MSGACETYRDDLVAEACGALPAGESRSLARHVAACPACRRDLDRLRAALAPLAAYDPEPPPRLVEVTQRHVARQMTMRLPRPGRLSRPRVIRLAMAAAVLLGLVTVVVVPALRQAPSGERPERTTAQLQGMYQAIFGYAQENSGWLPSAEGWDEAVRPYLVVGEAREPADGRPWSENYIFVQALRNWFGGLGPSDVLVVARRKGPDDRFQALTRAGDVTRLTETSASRWLHTGDRGE